MDRKSYKKCFAALLAVGAVVSSLSFVGAANETTDKMNEEQQPTTIHFSGVGEKIVNEDGSVTLAFGKDVGEKIINEDGSVTLAFGRHSEKTEANETPNEMNENRQPTAVHFYNVTEKIENEDGSLTLAFHNLTVQGEEMPKPEKDNISISDGGSARQFAKVKLNKSRPNSMTFTMDNLAYQPYQNIIIAGTCDKPGVELYFKLYRYVGGSPVLISSSQVTTTQEGIFSWRSSYGASGNYAIKVWTNKIRLSENSLCSISGNLIY